VARLDSPGWSHERRGDASPRGMIATAQAEQNPAYRRLTARPAVLAKRTEPDRHFPSNGRRSGPHVTFSDVRKFS